MVGLGELEAEQVEQAAGHVELARDAEVEQVVAHEVARQARRGPCDRVGRDQQQPVDHAVEPADGRVPRDIIASPACWISWMSVREVAALERPVVDHREMREDIIRQQEEVAQGVEERLAAAGVLQLVQIEDHPEHEHGGDDRDEGGRNGVGAEAGPRAGRRPGPQPPRRSAPRGGARATATRRRPATPPRRPALRRTPRARAPGPSPRSRRPRRAASSSDRAPGSGAGSVAVASSTSRRNDRVSSR